MTDVTPVPPTDTPRPPAPPTPSTTVGTPQTLGYDAFLKLLVEQMKNQDPLEPTSDTEYVAQLATFSNVEQNIITNDRLAALLTSNAIGDAGSLLGRTVTTADGRSGEVTAVSLTNEGTVVTLSDNRRVLLGEGVTIANGPS